MVSYALSHGGGIQGMDRKTRRQNSFNLTFLSLIINNLIRKMNNNLGS